MTLPEQSHSDREISYRIGWKKGKIHVPDNPSREADPTENVHIAANQAQELTQPADPLLAIIWKRAPYPGWKAAFWAAAALPAAGFAAIVWLVSRLTQG
ncbi:hypothetical protein [Paenibacillus sp. YN15]|uniref:hypothetical protein n=1 Tax=Paenibacillus sp. YN15 TaxID=1742774 RepID=UPI000DCCF497|nr:hypothetical protein [Paenibacillus sp. YN15]RAU92089.1 hypothetical protein DQG13_28135 [Paenibacillus sp. YN15]